MMIGQTISHYRIVEKIGEGGMGVVYSAEDTHLGRRVAIKIPTSTSDEHHFRARFLREARSASKLNHPHIAAIYDYGETDDGQPFIVMELVSGLSLGDLLHDSALTLERAVRVIEDVAEALAEAHRYGIIHRDIKPSNVFINERGEVKVLDFGLAKELNEEPTNLADPEARTLLATQTRSGVVVGTPLYLSPEQATGAAVDARSDLFALGTLLYECIAGRPPFHGAGVIEIAAQIIHVNPPPPSEINQHVPPELDRITLKALAKRPEARYQSADEMLTDLRAMHPMLRDAAQERTQRIALAPDTLRGKAFSTLSDIFTRPRLSLSSVLFTLAIIGLVAFGAWRLWPSSVYRPSIEAKRWYDEGIHALHNGAYYRASVNLEKAIENDSNFDLAHLRLAEAWVELDYLDKAKDELLHVSWPGTKRSTLSPIDELYLRAVRATVTGDLLRAIESYREIAQQVSDQEKSYAHASLGRAYERNEEVEKAITNYVAATDLDPQNATSYLRLGRLRARQKQYDSAATSFAKAEELYQLLGNYEGLAEVFHQRGVLFIGQDKTDKARAQFERALELARNSHSESQQILAQLQLSDVHYVEGAISQAEQFARKALNLAQQRGLENIAARGFIQLGDQAFIRNDLAEAEGNYKQALRMAQTNKARYNEALSLLALGSLKTHQRKTDEGLAHLKQALEFYKQGDYGREISKVLLLLGRTYRNKSDYKAAIEAFQQQLDRAKQLDDKLQEATFLEEIGKVLLQQERFAEAVNYLGQSREINESLNDQLIIGYILQNLGDALWQSGRYDEARSALNQATIIANQGGYSGLRADVYEAEAEMALSEHRYPEAIAKSRHALALDEGQSTETSIKAKRVLGLAQSLSNAKLDGKASCEQALAMAMQSGDPWLLSKAQLAFAKSLLENGDTRGALTAVLQAQETFTRTSQQHSEWHAWLLAARASHSAGNDEAAREYSSRAHTVFSNLEEKWGAEAFSNYLSRRDIQDSRKQLSALLAQVSIN